MELLRLLATSAHVDPSFNQRLLHGLDWAGRIGVTGAVLGFLLGFGLRRLGYRRVRRIGNVRQMVPPQPLDFSGYWGLTGIVIGFIVGIVHG